MADFDAEYGNRLGGLTDTGALRRRELQLAVSQAERACREARGLCEEARTERLIVQSSFEAWKRTERRRCEQAAEEQAKAKEKPASFKDRLAAKLNQLAHS